MDRWAPTDPPDTVEEIARSYLLTSEGDAGMALRCAISDALADLCEAERRTRRQDRLISRGFVRAALHEATRQEQQRATA
ncbi:hypothetical protein [Methylorubrum sp. SL192]|uniref:hypothetical protein n=1 Tax=Methylorubrum sp. SL192 TaxID=2995167 RepID=UPI0022758C78|nr:hypothetical protein [Methylorubrum sp. SL192]MCY1644041.1 hypothetical protein [Methylorubrum sp. SL192]